VCSCAENEKGRRGIPWAAFRRTLNGSRLATPPVAAGQETADQGTPVAIDGRRPPMGFTGVQLLALSQHDFGKVNLGELIVKNFLLAFIN
jgi:hypothetical protein